MGESGDNMVGSKSPLACLVGRYLFRTNAADNPYMFDMNLVSQVTNSVHCPVTVCPLGIAQSYKQ